MEDKDGRYAYLLQPIRDLAKNWEVDVAKQLEEYLDELEQITFTFDGGTTFLNFAEAALLIQGSASVYSRKIEYLYTLVYQTLDLIAEKQRQKQPASVDDEGKDVDVTFHKLNQEEQFISLDDIKEANNIDLIEEDFENRTSSYICLRTPVSLLPTDNHKRQSDVQLLSGRGEVLGNRGDFRVNTSVIHHSGALLIDTSFQPRANRNAFTLANDGGHNNIMPFTTHNNESFISGENEDIPENDGFNSDDNTFNGGINDTLRDDLHPAIEQEPIVEDSAWQVLDPHDKDAIPERAFKASRNWRIPKNIAIDTQAIRKRKRGQISITSNQPGISIIEFCSRAACTRQNQKLLKHAMNVICEDLEYISYEFAENQHILSREINKLFKFMTSNGQDSDDHDKHDDQENNIDGGYDDDYSDQDDFGIENNYNPDQEIVNNEHNMSIDPIAIEEQNLENQIPQTYEELVKEHLNVYAKVTRQYIEDSALRSRVNEWQDRIKPALENEEKHPPFDIHTYGQSVLDSLREKNDDAVSFEDVVSQKEPYEICRLFAATLQLANNGNIEISHGGKNEKAPVNTMTVKMLSTRLPHEALMHYKAPSLDDTAQSRLN
ncbi:Condensin-2 complex subunit H2 [Trichoplax sp. H2]|nr:Condensin-2 complex subunit H2 [Trichoplax sp. H2]|eukprot:RDD46576.1 Condensin-2 complex subunit H2 [Trichoplax sp. H2]